MVNDTLQKILVEKKISKYRVAKTLEVSWITVHFWAKGMYQPKPENENKLKKMLDSIG
jgi:predicted transcriptional regulator